MEIEETIIKQRSFLSSVRRLPERISEVVEHFFYTLGSKIALRPSKWLFGSVLIMLISLSGLFRFRQEKNPLKLWVPPNSDFVHDTEWLMSTLGQGFRAQSLMFTGENVLEPEMLIKLNEITNLATSIQTSDEPKISWTDLCLKVPSTVSHVLLQQQQQQQKRLQQQRIKRGSDIFSDDFFDEAPAARMNETQFDFTIYTDPKLYCNIYDSLPRVCLVLSILDIWQHDSNNIRRKTKEEIIQQINTVKISPTLSQPMNYTNYLGGITKDEDGRIVSAKAVTVILIVTVNFSRLDMDTSGNNAGTADWATEDVLKWEEALLRTLERSSKELQNWNDKNKTLNLYYAAGRSFGDISSSTMFQNIDKLIIGMILMFLYVQIILSNFNWVEWRFLLTATGLFCVGGAFIIAVGLCSAFGVPYGPVHTSLPFMLLGLGVDDLFVMMASWKQIHSIESNQNKALHERIGLSLGHAGSAICITSLTDVVAFLIGASTILPSLQSFCIYAAVGVLVTFLLQITFFIAFFTLDVKRIEKKKNGLIPCIVHTDHVTTLENTNETCSMKFIHHFYSKVVLTIPGKTAITLITITLACFGAFGSSQLEQWFDPLWFLPKGSYLQEYIEVRHQYYQKGHEAFVLIGEADYPSEFPKIMTLCSRLSNQSFVQEINPWPILFAAFVTKYFQVDLTKGNVKYEDFQSYLSKFLFSREGGQYQMNFRFDGNLTCGENAPRILMSRIDFNFIRFFGPHEWIPAMDDSKRITREAGLKAYTTVWSEVFGTWVTDKLIAQEVLRNLLLALICVMGTTAVLIAEPQTCFWILLCVLLTLLNVCGFMFFWGLTIDIVSCIALELAVGLSVDYAAHVAHAFLNAPPGNGNQDRKLRTLIAVKHIGAAVAYGAGSTLLALSMMAFSEAYVFRSFFKIFLLVILFGVWHGLFFLPVILSIVGPRSLKKSGKHISKHKQMNVETNQEDDKPLNKEIEM